MEKEIENNRRSGERDKDAVRWRGRQTQRERYIHTHTHHMSKQETKRERKTEMLKARGDKAERQVSPASAQNFLQRYLVRTHLWRAWIQAGMAARAHPAPHTLLSLRPQAGVMGLALGARGPVNSLNSASLSASVKSGLYQDFPGSLVVATLCSQYRGYGFDPQSGN